MAVDTAHIIGLGPASPGAQRPLPDGLLAGRLDDQIKALLAVAPPKAQLTVWHEAGTLDYPGYITPTSVRQMHVKMHKLCTPTPVGYGCLISGYPERLQSWMPKPGYPMD